MLNQSRVQQKIADLNAMTQLPPLSSLPQWSRVNTLDKARYPKPFAKDKHASTSQMMGLEEADNIESKSLNYGHIGSMERVYHLEKNIAFIRKQHQEVLCCLHQEIDKLRKENKVLLSQKCALMSQLPPLYSPPLCSCENQLDIMWHPKSFITDEDELTIFQMMSSKEKARNSGKLSDTGDIELDHKINHLQKCIEFIQKQQEDVLYWLHQEIDKLRKKNIDLQFKIVMNENSPSPTDDLEKDACSLDQRRDLLDQEDLQESRLEKELSSLSLKSKSMTTASEKSPSQDDRVDELRIIFLEEEIRKFRHVVQENRNRNAYLSQLLDHSEDRRRRQMAAIDTLRYQLSQGGSYNVNQTLSEPRFCREGFSRPRTLAECEGYIKHLEKVNEKQSHELETLKSDLRDVLYSHKWTPDAYLLAKAYIAEDDAKEQKQAPSGLPKIQLKQQTRKLPNVAYVQDNISLPALKQTVGNKAMERRKRTQILQKARLRHEVLP